MGKGPRALLLLLAAAAAAATTAAEQVVGDACQSEDGAAGSCRPIADCPEAQEVLRRGVVPPVCFYQGFSPVACCLAPSLSPTAIRAPSLNPTPAPAPSPSPTQRVATRMCTKYSDAVFVSETTFHIPKQMQCTIKGISFIVNGIKAVAGEFPHMALLGYGDAEAPTWKCGGALISERYVLTAAHCIITISRFPKVVRLGELNLKMADDTKHEDFGVARAIPHPDYVDGVLYNDVGLVRLSRDVAFSPSIRPLCLQVPQAVGRATAIVSGWGYTDGINPDNLNQLMKMSVLIQENETCQSAFKTLATTSRLRNGIDEQLMVCVGGHEESNSTCFLQGDNGGLLQIRLETPYCMYSVVGVRSFGRRQCGSGKAPAVYTRVSHFVPWIESIVWPNEK